MNNPSQINDESGDVARLDEMTPRLADELTDVDSVELEQVAGGGDGTALGVGNK